MWMIELRNGTHIGDLCFKGLGANATVEIGYRILEETPRSRSGVVVIWALKQPDVIRVEAET